MFFLLDQLVHSGSPAAALSLGGLRTADVIYTKLYNLGALVMVIAVAIGAVALTSYGGR